MKEKRKTKLSSLLLSILLFVLAAALLGTSATGYITQSKQETASLLYEMRTSAVMNAASGGLVESLAAAASAAKLQEVRKDPNFRSLGTEEINRRCEEAANAARAEGEAKYSNVGEIDNAVLEGKIELLEDAIVKYETLQEEEQAAYADVYGKLLDSVGSWGELTAEKEEDEILTSLAEIVPEIAENKEAFAGFAKLALAKAEEEAEAAAAAAEAESETAEAEPEVSEESAAAEEVVDYSYFTASAELDALDDGVQSAYDELYAELVTAIPDLKGLDKKMQKSVRSNIEGIIASVNDKYPVRYAAYTAQNADSILTDSQAKSLKLASNAENLLLLGIGVLLLAVLYTFWKPITGKLGVPRSIILLFFIYLILAAQFYKINISLMMRNILERVGMYGVLALAMLPGIQCGIGLNMGMTIGCISGLLATVISLQYNMTGAPALAFSIVMGALIAVPLGWAYSLLLNRMKGNEMTISTYVGFSFVSLMCIGWMALPFNNPKIIWMLAGHGLRVTHSLLGSFAHLMDNFLSFKVLGVAVPTGSILFFLFCCLIMWLFSRSKLGIAMSAVGSNPRFAEASGINVDKMRTLGTILSTMLAAIGIVVYSQAFGYAQLYTAPRQLGFIAASAILIGGATVAKAKVSHVIIGVVLFEGVLSMGQQIANAAVAGGGLSEVMRIMISNGIILYALTQSGGDSRG